MSPISAQFPSAQFPACCPYGRAGVQHRKEITSSPTVDLPSQWEAHGDSCAPSRRGTAEHCKPQRLDQMEALTGGHVYPTEVPFLFVLFCCWWVGQRKHTPDTGAHLNHSVLWEEFRPSDSQVSVARSLWSTFLSLEMVTNFCVRHSQNPEQVWEQPCWHCPPVHTGQTNSPLLRGRPKLTACPPPLCARLLPQAVLIAQTSLHFGQDFPLPPVPQLPTAHLPFHKHKVTSQLFPAHVFIRDRSPEHKQILHTWSSREQRHEHTASPSRCAKSPDQTLWSQALLVERHSGSLCQIHYLPHRKLEIRVFLMLW